MHHHRLVLNGPPGAVARLADDLCAAGAVALGGTGADAARRLVWSTPRPMAVEGFCARHRAVIVGVERFEALGDELQRLVVHGRDATMLERRTLRAGPEELDEEDLGADGLPGAGRDPDALEDWGLCLDEDGEPLDLAALRAAARRVMAAPVDLGSGLGGSSLDDALLIGPALGRLCVTASDPLLAHAPTPAALDSVVRLAAVALTVSAAGAGPTCAAELDYERAWRLTQATIHASRETLWARPGDADWPEWLMCLLAGASNVIERCSACLYRPEEPFASVHNEHIGTVDEELEHAAGRLVSTALQVLVLFDAAAATACRRGR